MVLCPDVAPYSDSRFDCRDLLQRSVIHYGAERKASSGIISTPIQGVTTGTVGSAFRSAETAIAFIDDLASRLTNRVQITTDGHRPYLEAIEGVFGGDVDFAMLVKIYGDDPNRSPERKYSPMICTGARKTRIEGNPDPRHVSTSYAERQNLTLRANVVLPG